MAQFVTSITVRYAGNAALLAIKCNWCQSYPSCISGLNILWHPLSVLDHL